MKRSAAITLLTLAFLSYQNCAKVAYDTIDQSKSMSKAETDGNGAIEVNQPGQGVGQNPAQQIENPTSPGNSSNDSCSQSSSAEQIQVYETTADLRDYCDQAKARALMVNPSNIQNLKGSFTASIGSLDRVVDVQGKLVLVGQDSQSKINLIQNIKGRLIVCNVKVDLVLDTCGRVEFVDSQIGKVQTHKGHLRILGSSSVDEFQDITGAVKDE